MKFLLAMFLSLFATSCFSNVRLIDEATDDMGIKPPWCFRANFKDVDNINTYSWNCFSSKNMCEGAIKISKKYGSLANVTSLINCRKI